MLASIEVRVAGAGDVDPASRVVDRGATVATPSTRRAPTPTSAIATATAATSSGGGTTTTPAATRTVDISEPVIHRAIVDSADPMDDIVSATPNAFGRGPMTPQQRIDARFRDADIPSCLTTDAFKFVPAKIGPFDTAGTPLALPFLVQAIATGKCRH